MPAFMDLTGQRFGRWTVLVFFQNHRGVYHWYCQCDCGVKKTVAANSLRMGQTKSCGCLMREMFTTHGHTVGRVRGRRHSAEYICWCSMLARCRRPNHPSFKDYGGRGIKVCERWNLFANFFADMGQRPSGTKGKLALYSLERIDNNGNYEPSNCKWDTRKVQASNRRR